MAWNLWPSDSEIGDFENLLVENRNFCSLYINTKNLHFLPFSPICENVGSQRFRSMERPFDCFWNRKWTQIELLRFWSISRIKANAIKWRNPSDHDFCLKYWAFLRETQESRDGGGRQMVKDGRCVSTPSALRTDSDGRQVKFLKERTEADEVRDCPSR